MGGGVEKKNMLTKKLISHLIRIIPEKTAPYFRCKDEWLIDGAMM